MKTLTPFALALFLFASAASAAEKQGISISFDSDDTRTHLAPRHSARDARLALTTRGGAAVLLLTNDVIAVQLSDTALDQVETKSDANFLEELLVVGVRLAVSKSVEYPVANIRSAELRDGVLVLTNDQGKPVFQEILVNGKNVTRDLSTADAVRFVNAFRAVKGKR
jgi:hypothetical protein